MFMADFAVLGVLNHHAAREGNGPPSTDTFYHELLATTSRDRRYFVGTFTGTSVRGILASLASLEIVVGPKQLPGSQCIVDSGLRRKSCLHFAVSITMVHRVKTVCLTIRDCPAEVHRALSERAAAHRRSLNSEVIVVLENALETPRMSEADLRRAIRSVPSKTRLSLVETRGAIREGRK